MANENTKSPTASFGWRALIAAALVALGGLLTQIGRTMLEDEQTPPTAPPAQVEGEGLGPTLGAPPGVAPTTETN